MKQYTYEVFLYNGTREDERSVFIQAESWWDAEAKAKEIELPKGYIIWSVNFVDEKDLTTDL